jgi:hypothetical protein
MSMNKELNTKKAKEDLTPQKILHNIQVAKPLDSVQQEYYIEAACSMSNSKIKLLIVD